MSSHQQQQNDGSGSGNSNSSFISNARDFDRNLIESVKRHTSAFLDLIADAVANTHHRSPPAPTATCLPPNRYDRSARNGMSPPPPTNHQNPSKKSSVGVSVPHLPGFESKFDPTCPSVTLERYIGKNQNQTGSPHIDKLYPTGDISFDLTSEEVGVDKDGVLNTPIFGWAMVHSSMRKPKYNDYRKVFKLNCLGCFECRPTGLNTCEWRSRPLIGTGRGSNAIPKGPSCGVCPTPGHGTKFVVHVNCSCSMTAIDKGDYYEIQHVGDHKHLLTPVNKPTHGSQKTFESLIRWNPEATPLQLCKGTSTRPPVSAINPYYHNVDATKYQRKKVKTAMKTRIPSSTDALMEFIHRLPPEFDFSSETQGGASCLTLLPCYLPDIISSDNQYPLQSDAIESFTKQEFTTKKPYVMITSTRCDLYRGTVPVAISVLFGKSEKCYAHHFYQVVKNYPFKTIDELKQVFPGNTSDFEVAQLNGFNISVKILLNERKTNPTDPDVTIDIRTSQDIWRFCSVHFKRNTIKISRMADIVPQDKQRLFYDSVILLISEHISLEQFLKTIENLLAMFPKVSDWMKWHLQKDRAKILFPVLKKGETSSFAWNKWLEISDNTNRQEGFGGIFKMLHPNPVLNANEVLQHALETYLFIEHRRNFEVSKLIQVPFCFVCV